MSEKEYKFLVDKLPNESCDDIKHIIQYYFDITSAIKILTQCLKLNSKQIKDIHSVRLRMEKTHEKEIYILNAKSNGLFLRQEYECKISKELSQNIIKNLKIIGKIEKERYVFFNSGYKFEFDIYKNKNFITCEVEVKNNENYINIIKILTKKFNLNVKDVTMDEKYKNYNLTGENVYEWD